MQGRISRLKEEGEEQEEGWWCTHNGVGQVMEWFASERPHLIEYHPIAPHITGRRVLIVVQRLGV